MDVLILLAITSILILLNAIFVAAEFGLIAAPPTRIAQAAEAGSRAARRLLSIIRDVNAQNRYLATAQIGITVVSLGLGMYGEHTLGRWILAALEDHTLLAHTVATVLSVGLLTYLHVVLGEMVAKSVALQYPETTALYLVRPMALLEILLWPAIFVLNGAGNRITRLIGLPPAADTQARLFSPQELEFIVQESYEKGLLEMPEHLFIENILDLKERTVGQVMTPRTQIVGISADEDEEMVLQTVCKAQHSRYPIYEEDLDQIIGVLHIKDLARDRANPSGPFNLREMTRRRPVLFVPESLSLEAMLVRFRQERVPLAVVIDEFGGTAGILTLEDLVEEVVGEIRDEFDVGERPPFERIDGRTLRVQGSFLLDELNQHFHLDLDYPQVHTVGGLIMTLLGRVPKPGDRVSVDGIVFEVQSVERMAVQWVRVILPKRASSTESAP